MASDEATTAPAPTPAPGSALSRAPSLSHTCMVAAPSPTATVPPGPPTPSESPSRRTPIEPGPVYLQRRPNGKMSMVRKKREREPVQLTSLARAISAASRMRRGQSVTLPGDELGQSLVQAQPQFQPAVPTVPAYPVAAAVPNAGYPCYYYPHQSMSSTAHPLPPGYTVPLHPGHSLSYQVPPPGWPGVKHFQFPNGQPVPPWHVQPAPSAHSETAPQADEKKETAQSGSSKEAKGTSGAESEKAKCTSCEKKSSSASEKKEAEAKSDSKSTDSVCRRCSKKEPSSESESRRERRCKKGKQRKHSNSSEGSSGTSSKASRAKSSTAPSQSSRRPTVIYIDERGPSDHPSQVQSEQTSRAPSLIRIGSSRTRTRSPSTFKVITSERKLSSSRPSTRPHPRTRRKTIVYEEVEPSPEEEEVIVVKETPYPAPPRLSDSVIAEIGSRLASAKPPPSLSPSPPPSPWPANEPSCRSSRQNSRPLPRKWDRDEYYREAARRQTLVGQEEEKFARDLAKQRVLDETEADLRCESELRKQRLVYEDELRRGRDMRRDAEMHRQASSCSMRSRRPSSVPGRSLVDSFEDPFHDVHATDGVDSDGKSSNHVHFRSSLDETVDDPRRTASYRYVEAPSRSARRQPLGSSTRRSSLKPVLRYRASTSRGSPARRISRSRSQSTAEAALTRRSPITESESESENDYDREEDVAGELDTYDSSQLSPRTSPRRRSRSRARGPSVTLIEPHSRRLASQHTRNSSRGPLRAESDRELRRMSRTRQYQNDGAGSQQSSVISALPRRDQGLNGRYIESGQSSRQRRYIYDLSPTSSEEWTALWNGPRACERSRSRSLSRVRRGSFVDRDETEMWYRDI